MATWPDPTGDLRKFLDDTSDHNRIKNQDAIGDQDGTNTRYYTFRDRLLASGVQSGASDQSARLRVFLAGTELVNSGINVTDATLGEFTLQQAPTVNQEMKVTYAYQDHRADELTFYLTQAINEISVSAAADVPPGLQTAALHFAASFAHDRLAERWLMRKIDQFGLHETAPDEISSRVDYHERRAKWYLNRAEKLRRDFYEFRKDRGRAPAFGILKRVPQGYTPRR